MKKYEFVFDGIERTAFENLNDAIVFAIKNYLEEEEDTESPVIKADSEVSINIFKDGEETIYEVYFGHDQMGTNCLFENLFDLDWFMEEWVTNISFIGEEV